MKNDFSKKLIALTQGSLNAVTSPNEKKIFGTYTETTLNVSDADFGFIWVSVSEIPNLSLFTKVRRDLAYLLLHGTEAQIIL